MLYIVSLFPLIVLRVEFVNSKEKQHLQSLGEDPKTSIYYLITIDIDGMSRYLVILNKEDGTTLKQK